VTEYCSSRGLLSLARKGEDSFIDVGFDNWKKGIERLNQHASSNLHKEALFKIESLQQEGIDSLLNRQTMNDQRTHREMLMRQLSSLKYLLRQGMAVRGPVI